MRKGLINCCERKMESPEMQEEGRRKKEEGRRKKGEKETYSLRHRDFLQLQVSLASPIASGSTTS